MQRPPPPASAALARFGPELETLLEGHGVARSFITDELEQMVELQLAKTNNPSLLGSMNEFAYLADVYRHSAEVVDLTALSLRLAETPSSPLYKRHITPHDELMARAAV